MNLELNVAQGKPKEVKLTFDQHEIMYDKTRGLLEVDLMFSVSEEAVVGLLASEHGAELFGRAMLMALQQKVVDGNVDG